jgi:predicted N-acetyltransferase YhbS
LDVVAVRNDENVGNIVYCESEIIDSDREDVVLTLGLLSVLPECQKKRIGGGEGGDRAGTDDGDRAVLIYGVPAYYQRVGFKPSKEYRTTNEDLQSPAALLALESYSNALSGIKGVFDEGKHYQVDELGLLESKKGFPPKEKRSTKIQDRFNESGLRDYPSIIPSPRSSVKCQPSLLRSSLRPSRCSALIEG